MKAQQLGEWSGDISIGVFVLGAVWREYASHQSSFMDSAERIDDIEVRMVAQECKATIGQVGNLEHENQSDGKAGRSRWRGRRPHVRGVAMNPVDHPHGGGEGKSSGGRHPVTPCGVPTKGYKTRVKKASDRLIVKKRS